MAQSHHYWLNTAAFLLFTGIMVCVYGDFRPRIQIQDYANPSRRLANGSCCSNPTMQIDNCPSSCDETATLCFRSTDHPMEDMESCPIFEQGGIKPFTSRGVQLRDTLGPWPGEVQLLVEITDSVSGGLVDVIIANITQAVGNLADVQNYQGIHGVATFSFGITVMCIGDFCGSDCDTECVARDDDSGHFACDQLMCAVCLSGFQNVSNNCTDCAVREGCSAEGGFCEGPGECQCREGYSGASCDILEVSSTPNILPTSSMIEIVPTSSDSLFAFMASSTSSPSMTSSMSPSATSTTTSRSAVTTTVIVLQSTPSNTAASPLTPQTVERDGLMPAAIAGLIIGLTLLAILILLVLVVVFIALLICVTKRRHKRKNYWYVTANSGADSQVNTLREDRSNSYSLNGTGSELMTKIMQQRITNTESKQNGDSQEDASNVMPESEGPDWASKASLIQAVSEGQDDSLECSTEEGNNKVVYSKIQIDEKGKDEDLTTSQKFAYAEINFS